ncbi:MAG: arylsulfatase [Saprospiraceae bacterium]|nr:arylsulfatase [Saprospiraceae bacterium]
MKCRIAWALPVLLLLSISIISGCQDRQATKSPPNVIIVITDDQGYGDLSCHGHPVLKTPNLDQLHAQSTRLTDFHVSTTCAPTRSALLTGHYNNRTGVWHTIAGRSLLRQDEVTFADLCTSNGYATGIFGKWHLGDNFPFRPQDRGFQETLVHGGGGVQQGPDYWGNDYFDDTYYRNGQPEQQQGYCTDIWFDAAIQFMRDKSQAAKPFFCYLATNAPHSPFSVKDKYAASYQDDPEVVNPAFLGMIANIDENMGKLLTYLDDSGLAENTILVFLTDNGTAAGVFLDKDQHVVKGFNAGMRAKKGSMYEGGHRVPCFIRWPQGGVNVGRDLDDLTTHIDLVPTLMDFLNFAKKDNLDLDGISLADVLLGRSERLPTRTLITDTQRIEWPKKWKHSAVMREQWRLINGAELYDLSEDPGQRTDVSADHPAVVERLRKDYEQWWTDIVPSFENTPRIVLCSSNEPVSLLHAHDMHMDQGFNSVPWNQQMIRRGAKSRGWFEVHVPAEGRYRFELYRWPPHTGHSLLDSLPAPDVEPNSTMGKRPAGVSLQIAHASLQIDEEEFSKETSGAAQSAAFESHLKEGDHQLRISFAEAGGEPFVPYYTVVKKLD